MQKRQELVKLQVPPSPGWVEKSVQFGEETNHLFDMQDEGGDGNLHTLARRVRRWHTAYFRQ
jgi:hypothetical protein